MLQAKLTRAPSRAQALVRNPLDGTDAEPATEREARRAKKIAAIREQKRKMREMREAVRS